MKKLRSIIFIWLLSSIFTNQALAREVLTWEDCVKESLQKHPDLISSREKVKQAMIDKDITRSAVFPQISSRAGAKTSEAVSGKKSDTYSYSITGEQLMFDGFKTVTDIKSASETISAQEYNYAVISSNIRLKLRDAFITLLRAQELIALSEEIDSRRKQNLELVQIRYDAGREHKGALMTAQADLAEAEFETAQAERNLSLARQKLTKELGREKKVPIEVRGTFDIQEIDREKPDFEFLADTTPFLKELISKKETAKLDYKSAQADFFPEVYLNGSMGRTASNWPPNGNEWSAEIAVSCPIFEGGRRIAQLSKAKSQLKQAQADERGGRDSVILTLEETWKNFQDAADVVLVRKKFLEAAQERAKIANAQYSQGLITFDDWIIIENNLVNAKKAYLDAQASLLAAKAYWIQAKGGTLEYVQE